jgi:hypothetical protein
VSCGSNSSKVKIVGSTIDSTDTISKNEKSINDTLPGEIKPINLTTASNIKVLSVNKELKGDSTDEDYNRCKKWILTAKQIGSIIRKFKSMSSEEQYLAYSFYQCRISGEIKIDGIIYKYWMGAGGTLTLKNNNETLDFGCPGKECQKYFISGELTEKEMN